MRWVITFGQRYRGFQNPLWCNYKALVDPNPACLLWVSPFRILLWGWSSLNLLSLIDYNRFLIIILHSFPNGSVVKRIHLQCRRHKRCGFNPWVGKILWRRKWQPTAVFLPKENPIDRWAWQLQSIGSQSQTGLKQLSTHRGMHLGEKTALCLTMWILQNVIGLKKALVL